MQRRPPAIPTLTYRGDRRSRHPWIYAKMIDHPRPRPSAGAVVEVRDGRGAFVGRGIYHPGRTLAVRILTRNVDEAIDAAFFERRLEAAKRLREEVLRIGLTSNAYRLVHGEADGLPGLIIDKFADTIVVEPYSAGWLGLSDEVLSVLGGLYPECRVAFRPDARTERAEGVSFDPPARKWPAPASALITENGVRMHVDFGRGHKTGYFLDQRDNRREVARLAGGREVLDLFCYTGGFGIAAAKSGAASVTSVDLDETALETAETNARDNGVRIDFVHANCFDYLRGAGERKWDLVVVDPAKLAAVRDELPRALKTYDDINRLAFGVVRPGGIVVSCSCSGLVGEAQFLSVLGNAARGAGVELQIFRIAGAAGDHPVRTDFPEGRYLKAVFAVVVPA